MLEAVKRQLKLTYDHAILSYVMSILGFLVAMILWGVMRSVLRQEAQYIPLGTIMALGLCGLCILFTQIFQIKLMFDLEIRHCWYLRSYLFCLGHYGCILEKLQE